MIRRCDSICSELRICGYCGYLAEMGIGGLLIAIVLELARCAA